MISTRTAALLGLTVPLSPIMVAVLGIWPETAVETLPDYRVPLAGPDGPSSSYEREEEDFLDRVRRQARESQQRAQRHKLMLLALAFAALEYE